MFRSWCGRRKTCCTPLEHIHHKSNSSSAREPLSGLPEVKAARDAKEFIIYATTSRHRMIEAGRELAQVAQPDLHLALWNAYTIANVPAPILVTHGPNRITNGFNAGFTR